ncbi:carbamoyltransferase [Leptospira sp. FAT2]|nr:carbamoyltransferase [Leptospira sanjuanensis]MCG6193028.1 carbamoyltransferase [Leptospira sanjuanensis]
MIEDGKIVFAAQEERYTRKKHDPNFPINALKKALEFCSISVDEISYVGFYEKPHLKFHRLLQNFADFYPQGNQTFSKAISTWIDFKLWIPEIIRKEIIALSPSRAKDMLWDGKVIFSEHHKSHAASAFYPSPFKEAAILVADGVGEFATTSMWLGKEDVRSVPTISFLKDMHFPHSLGMLYSAFTYYLGFKVNSGEYKVMGLAPYGEPKYAKQIIDRFVNLKSDGSFELNMDYFSFPYDDVMIREGFDEVMGFPRRKAEDRLEPFHFDIAASLQSVLENILLGIVKHIHKETKMENLCMAGGVALNCVANGKIFYNSGFNDIWIQPAAGDAGGAVGVAYYIWHEVLKERKAVRKNQCDDLMSGCYLGEYYHPDEVKSELIKRQIPFQEIKREEFSNVVSDLLTEGNVIGWFQGRMEFGPRALGGRSIIADPRSRDMQKKLNLKIKFRESFRPFAPSILWDRVQDWFELLGKPDSKLVNDQKGYASHYMLMVASVNQDRSIEMSEKEKALNGIDKLNVVRSEIPSCTHVDYSARIQTVRKEYNSAFFELIDSFFYKTGVPILVNTSFNVRGEPIVCRPMDAINCFLGTHMDYLAIENIIVSKKDIPSSMLLDYKDKFDLD